MIYSIIETAKENGLKPWQYLTHIFERMPNIDFKTEPKLLKSILPWAELPEECYLNKKN
ncbi:transposase domain-containing protein [Oceanirhabdus seepicola]|uniref:Transposase domain-containing protein n=1 Tax=Oceanirhabdus seepicola TaxID=2828781 RepID=A0A9J6NZ75_9CLOT|nr:transposase domain-containing protein [Oceanirhabdus seepicola]